MNNQFVPNASNGFAIDDTFDDLDAYSLEIMKNVILLIDSEIVVTEKIVSRKLNLLKYMTDFIIDYLSNKTYVQFTTIDNEKLFSLTHEGKKLSNRCKKAFQDNFKSSEANDIKFFDTNKNFNRNTILSFIGCFISDKSGKTLLQFEIFDGALDYFLNKSNELKNKVNHIDLQLIPMFISALVSFSEELNLQDLSELKIQGANIKIQIIRFDKYTITFLINPEVSLNPIMNKIKDYFNILFEKYKNDLEICAKTGSMNPVSYLNKIGNEMLKELNKFVYLVEFKNIVNNLGYFDMIYAKTLYDKLDKLYKDSNLNFAILLEKIKMLKNYLLKAMLNEDLEEVKEIINKMQVIESNLS